MPRNIADITIDELVAAEETYRERNSNPVQAGRDATALALKAAQTSLAIPINLYKDDGAVGTAATLVLGIEIGLILAEQSREESSPVAVDQAVS